MSERSPTVPAGAPALGFDNAELRSDTVLAKGGFVNAFCSKMPTSG